MYQLEYVLLMLLTTKLAAIDILQIVPGFTNSHLLFNYRLVKTLKQMGHNVKLWTQMEMNMVSSGVSLPEGVSDLQIPIHFSDKMKAEGLKASYNFCHVFQEMMFKKNDEYDLWWTGQQFKDMRIEACEQMLLVDQNRLESLLEGRKPQIVIGHFHDLCPLGLAKKVGSSNLVWITHGTSLFDFAAVQMGIRTYPSYVPHPLSSYSDRMNFFQRLVNVLWSLSMLDFVNLPINLLYEENSMYRRIVGDGESDLWDLSKNVSMMLINGEQMLDFPRPLSLSIRFIGELDRYNKKKVNMEAEFQQLADSSDLGFIIFSFGTVCNTSSMPQQMRKAFVDAFAFFPRYTIIWRFEDDLPEASSHKNIKLFRWLPQKQLMYHPKVKLLIAHGGYNSFLEASKAGVPLLLVPLFADQFINARRAERFGFAESLDKTKLIAEVIRDKMAAILTNSRYKTNAEKLSAMLEDKPAMSSQGIIAHMFRLSLFKNSHYALKSRYNLSFLQYYSIDIMVPIVLVILLLF
uniref:glucuronosyltransferase n=1 Tax=Syphacia muris TaxID=451379 RepID=A0A0N5AXF9_9BILA